MQNVNESPFIRPQCTCMCKPVRSYAGSLWGRVASWLATGQAAGAGQAEGTAGPPRLSAEEDPDAVHIFTIASGHMYERLQKIMILSVLRNTKCAYFPCCPIFVFSFESALSELDPVCQERR